LDKFAAPLPFCPELARSRTVRPTLRIVTRKSSTVPLLSLGLALGVSCVPQARYDDIKARLDHATEGENAERRRAAGLEVDLETARKALEVLQERTALAESAVELERANLAQARFESDVIGQEREDAKRMSEQLLIELERVAGHLRAYADDKASLDAELTAARTRLAALALDEKANHDRFTAARELTLALAAPLEKKALRLALVEGEIAIQFPKEAAFQGDGAALTADGKAALEKAAGVLNPLALDVQVEQPGEGEGEAQRAKTVSDALVGFGLAKERVIVAEQAADPAATAGDAAGEEAGTTSDPDPTDPETSAELPPMASEPDSSAVETSDTELELRLRFPSSGDVDGAEPDVSEN
jgi:hypothetical protein